MDKGVERVVVRIRKWYDKATTGRVGRHTLIPRSLRDGEQLTAFVAAVGARQVSPDPAQQDLRTGPFYRSESPTVRGTALATSKRLLIAGSGKTVKMEWPWESIESITIGDGAQWLTFKQSGVDDHVTVLLRLRLTIVWAPKPAEVAVHLLSIEGSWYIWKGQGDEWLAGLPLRFREPLS